MVYAAAPGGSRRRSLLQLGVFWPCPKAVLRLFRVRAVATISREESSEEGRNLMALRPGVKRSACGYLCRQRDRYNTQY